MLTHQDSEILKAALCATPQFRNFRGREALLQSALGGYPLSGEIEKALNNVNLEGGPSDVAFELLNYLEPLELAPNTPALAVLAQAIHPQGTAREQLAALRTRLGWGSIDPAALTADNWRDHRPAEEITPERIIGENTLRPMYYLRRALAAADAVVRIDLSGQAKGSGFLVAPGVIMTNNHVIANEAEAQTAQACFFDEVSDPKTAAASQPKKTVKVEALLYTNKQLDFTLLRLQPGAPQPESLPLRPIEVAVNARVAIIQHPGGYPKQISLQNNLVAFADTRVVQYYTSTSAGSSGSPVLNDNFEVVAIHHCWVHNAAWDGGNGQLRFIDAKQIDAKQIEDLQYRNQGISMIAILKDLETNAPELHKLLHETHAA